MGSYKIMVETTNSKKSAQSHLNKLQDNDISCHIVNLNLDNLTFYSVQAGPYSYKKEALENVDKIKRLGVRNAFITSSV